MPNAEGPIFHGQVGIAGFAGRSRAGINSDQGLHRPGRVPDGQSDFPAIQNGRSPDLTRSGDFFWRQGALGRHNTSGNRQKHDQAT
jgi:hypothetical protein